MPEGLSEARGAAARGPAGEPEVVVAEQHHGRSSPRVAGDHVQQPQLHRVSEVAGQPHRPTGHQVVAGQPGRRPVERPDGRGGATRLAVHVDRRCGVGLHVERRADAGLAQQAGQVPVDLADLGVVAGDRHAVAAGRGSRTADEVVALVSGDHEQGVRLGDAVRGQPGEEGAEGRVLGPQLSLIAGLAGAERAAGHPGLVHVAEVGKGDGDAVQLHAERVRQRVRPGHAVVAGEPDVAAGVLDHFAGQVADRARRADDGLDELAAVPDPVAVIAACLTGQHVRPRACPAGGRAAGAVHGQAHEVSRGLALQLGVLGLPGLGGIRAEDVRHVGQGVLQLGVGAGDRAEFAARAGVGNPRRRRVLPVSADHGRGAVADRAGGEPGVVVHDGGRSSRRTSRPYQ